MHKSFYSSICPELISGIPQSVGNAPARVPEGNESDRVRPDHLQNVKYYHKSTGLFVLLQLRKNNISCRTDRTSCFHTH